MINSKIVAAVAVLLLSAMGMPSFATEPLANASGIQPPVATTLTAKLATSCLNDLHAFHEKMQKDGYWLGGSADAYGYPVGDLGFSFGYATGPYPLVNQTRYPNVRPGYEVRTLVAAANILARHGQQKPCEDVLATAKAVYSQYVADLHGRGAPIVEEPRWQQDEIAAAQPVTNNSNSFRSDQLLGTDVRTPQNETLGTVDDLVMSPQTGKIAYLVIARGGIFGIGEKYVPVPWENFKVTPKANLLVLDATRKMISDAPQVVHNQSMTTEQFNQEGPKVDAFWKAHFIQKSSN